MARSRTLFGRMGGGFGLTGRPTGTGAVALGLLPVLSLFTVIGDGTMSDSAAQGTRNAVNWAFTEMAGRLLPSERFNLCQSGDSFAGITTRLPYATAQVGSAGHVIMLGSFGHNDALMSTDPAGAPGIALMDGWKAVVDAFLADVPAGTHIRIILTTTIGSTVSGESTYAATVNTAQKSYLNAKAALDARISVWDAWALYNHSNASTLSLDSGANYTHPSDRGARQLAFGDGSNPGLYTVLNALVDGATKAAMFTALSAIGTNFDSDYTLSGGTSGTKSGTVTPTGDWPTGKRITNNLTNGSGVGVVGSIIDQSGYKQAKAVISGTPGATNTIVMDDTASITATGLTPGQYAAPVIGVKIDDGAGGAPSGLMTWQLLWGNYGTIGSLSNLTGLVSDGVGRTVDTILVANPNPIYATSSNPAANPAFSTRYFASALDTEITIEHPMLVQLYATARAAPCPIWKAGGEGANYVQRLTGTFVNGQSLRAEPGRWSGGGLSNTTITNRKIYMTDTNSGADAAVDAGTELADLTGSTWTWTASGLLLTKYLWVDVTVDNGIGSAVTERAGPYTIGTTVTEDLLGNLSGNDNDIAGRTLTGGGTWVAMSTSPNVINAVDSSPDYFTGAQNSSALARTSQTSPSLNQKVEATVLATAFSSARIGIGLGFSGTVGGANRTWYVFHVDTAGSFNYVLNKFVEGSVDTALATVTQASSVTMSTNTQYDWELEIQDNGDGSVQLIGRIDGTQIFSVQDASPLAAGACGIRCGNGGRIYNVKHSYV